MNWEEYLEASCRARPSDLHYEKVLETLALGLVGESGELCDVQKKCVGQGHKFDQTEFLGELGDCAFYIAWAWCVCGVKNYPRAMAVLPRSSLSYALVLFARQCRLAAERLLELNVYPLRESLGDALGYLRIVAEAVGSSVEDVFAMNIEKLKQRYPERFLQEASTNMTVETADG